MPTPPPPAVTARAASDGRALNLALVRLAARRRYKLIVAAALGMLALAYYVIRDERPTYRATAVVRLGDERRSVTSAIEDPQVDPTRMTNPVQTQIQLLQSRELIGRVVDSLGVRLKPQLGSFGLGSVTVLGVDSAAARDTLHLVFNDSGFIVRAPTDSAFARYGEPVRVAGVRFSIGLRPTIAEADWTVGSRSRAIDEVLSNLDVRTRLQTNIVDVSYTSYRPSVAQRIANLTVETFRNTSASAAQRQSHRRRVFLEEQLRRADSLLESAQLALSAFRRRAETYSAREKMSAKQRDLEVLDTRRAELEADGQLYAALLERLEQSRGPERREALRALLATPGLVSNPSLSQLSRQLATYQTTYDSLTTGAWRSAETNPDVVRLAALIVGTERELVSAVQGQRESIRARLSALDAMRRRGTEALQEMPFTEAQEVRLVQQVQTITTMGDALRGEYLKARMAEAVEVGQVEIVDLATLPYVPLGQLRGLKLTFAVMFGLAFGLALAVALEMMDGSIRRPDQLEGVLHIPGLAVVPLAVHRREDTRWHRFGAILHARSRAAPRQIESLVALEQTPSPGGDAYRLLRTTLAFGGRGRALRTLVVTSATAGEGKSVTAANLAATFAREGMRVLLVDCDLRRGKLHRTFGVPRAPGLLQFLSGEGGHELLRPTSLEGLTVFPSGARGDGLTPQVSSSRMRRALEALMPHFDLIVLDTPPVLAVADAAIIAPLADGVLLVVRAGQTSRIPAQQAVQQLDNVGAHIIGAVLNDPDGEVRQYGYAYYHPSDYAPAAR